MAANDLTAQQLREYLHYEPASDTWTRIAAHKMRPDRQGKPAGCRDNGYWHVQVRGFKYKAHRLVWLWHYGTWPSGHIDHIDGDRSNNRIENLRDAPRNINAQNQRKPHANNTTGFLGVHRLSGKFAARLSLNGKRLYLGMFDTAEDAYAAYLKAKREHHPGCTL